MGKYIFTDRDNMVGKKARQVYWTELQDAVNNLDDEKVDKISGKELSTNDYTTLEKNKLSGIEAGAEKNKVISVAGKTGAISLTKSDVGLSNVDNTSDTNKPISTATQTALNSKVNNSQVLTNVPSGAKFTDTIYTHPTTAGNKHIPTGGNVGQILKNTASGTATWQAESVTPMANNLTTTGAGSALDARQGKTLKDLLDAHFQGRSFQVAEITRDISIAGMQTVPLDFMPELVIVFAGVSDTKKHSIGVATITGTQFSKYRLIAGSLEGNDRIHPTRAISIPGEGSSTNVTIGEVVFSGSNLQINWTSDGSGSTGTAQIQVVAFRHGG